ncbi:hypothetical protein [Maricaulis parjimensis]|uniref:hypothetical protein n=1 Tax=Maricaulis parjimensis TaxID=144023 RepID=UPI00193A5CE9|nr:hypothetical protein [Maricaulis parjimensis]
MLIHFLAGLALIQAEPAKPEPAPEPAPDHTVLNGRWAELQASGHSGCHTAGIPRALDIRILPRPPHDRSDNIGEFGFYLAPNITSEFVVAGLPHLALPDAQGAQIVTLDGGWLNTVGREIDGISDGQLRGHYQFRMRLDAQDQLWLEDVRYSENRPRAGTDILVEDGELPDGTVLRGFARCTGD